jgi:hypothetical protein
MPTTDRIATPIRIAVLREEERSVVVCFKN